MMRNAVFTKVDLTNLNFDLTMLLWPSGEPDFYNTCNVEVCGSRNEQLWEIFIWLYLEVDHHGNPVTICITINKWLIGITNCTE